MVLPFAAAAALFAAGGAVLRFAAAGAAPLFVAAPSADGKLLNDGGATGAEPLAAAEPLLVAVPLSADGKLLNDGGLSVLNHYLLLFRYLLMVNY